MKKICFALLLASQLFALPFDGYKNQVSAKVIQDFNVKFKNCAQAKEWDKSCNKGTIEFWDKVLNLEYGLIRNSVEFDKKSEHEKFLKEIKVAQLAWIKYRDAAEKSIQAFYGQFDGTIWNQEAIDEIINLTKDRAMNLCNMRKSIDLSGEANILCGEKAQ